MSERFFVVDAGFLPTTRQMAIAVADDVDTYCTPFALSRQSRLPELPVAGRAMERRLLPEPLAARSRSVAAPCEGARQLLTRAGVQAMNDALLRRRNVAADRAAARMLPAGATVIGQYGACLETFGRARALGARTVLDYPIARTEYGQEILREEARLWPDFADSMHGAGVPAWYLDRMAAEVQLAGAIIVGSRFAAMSFEGAVDARRVHIVPYGVDTAAYQPSGAARRDGPLRVLFAGTITQRKGIVYLLEAMRLLDGQKFELTMTGPMLGSGAGLRRYGGLYRHVSGVRPRDMPALYRRADVLVLPSLLEGSALVVLEAMASGLPVVVTPNAGADAVRDGIDGFVVPVRSPEAIAERLEQLLDPELRQRMGEAGRARSLEYTWESFHRGFRQAIGLAEGEEALSA